MVRLADVPKFFASHKWSVEINDHNCEFGKWLYGEGRKDIEKQMPEIFSLEKDFLEPFYPSIKIYGYSSNAYFIDIGIPTDYEKAKHELT